VFVLLNGRLCLTGTLLTILLSGVEPMLQNVERLGFNFEERETGAEIGLHVDDSCLGLEQVFAGENFHEHESVLGKRIHHVEVATVEA